MFQEENHEKTRSKWNNDRIGKVSDLKILVPFWLPRLQMENKICDTFALYQLCRSPHTATPKDMGAGLI